MQIKKPHVLAIINLFIFFLASIYITYPLIFHLGSLATGLGDELVMGWIHTYVIHAITTNPYSLFEANLYYPYHNTLAYAETLILTSILGLPIAKIVAEPIAIVNFTFISSLTFLGFSLFLLSYYLTKDYLISLLAGVLVIFSPAVLDYATHMQILAVEWIPLSILFFLHFIKSAKSKFLIICLLFFLFQIYNSFMPAYFIVISLFITVLYHWFYERKQIKKIITKKNIFILGVTFLLALPVVLPYYAVAKEFHYVRDIRDAIHFAMQPEDLLYPSRHTRLSDVLGSLPFNQVSQNNEFKPGYIGFAFSVLCLYAFYYFIKYFKKTSISIRSFMAIGLFGLLTSFGPVLHLGRQTIHEPFPIVLPYTLFYYILPGFNGFRNSGRWEMLFILSMSIVVALVLKELLKNFSPKIKVLILSLLIIFSIAEFNFPMHFDKVPQVKDFPKVDYWLATTSQDTVVIKLPIYSWGDWPFTGSEIQREYYSTLHFRKTVNGYTSFSPPEWQKLIIRLRDHFTDKETIQQLKDMGVDYIIVDKKLYDESYKVKQQKIDGEVVLKSLKNNSSLKFIKQFDNNYVFQFIN